MPFVSVTRLRIRAARFLPAFAVYTFRSRRQLREAVGYLAGRLAPGPSRTFWTITVWESQAAMRAYRSSGAHMRAMPKLLEWCDESAVAHWEQPVATPPSVFEAAQRLGRDGRVSPLPLPSEAHAAGVTWPDGVVPSPGASITPRMRQT